MLITLEQMNKVKGLDKLYRELQAIGYINLKLYNISSYLYNLDIPDDEQYRLFDLFCQEQYEFLKQEQYEFLQEEMDRYNSDINFAHIGNTSSFYIINEEINSAYYHGNAWNEYIWKSAYDENMDCSEMIIKMILEANNIEVLNDNLKALDYGKSDPSEVIEDIFEYIDDEIDSITKILNLHKSIQDFKDNQLDYFRDWLDSMKYPIEEDIITEMNQYADLFLESDMIDFFNTGKVKEYTVKVEDKETFEENLSNLDYPDVYKLHKYLSIIGLEKGLIFEYDGKIYTLI